MFRIKEARRTILICTFLGAVTFAAFWPVLNNDFIKFDDRQYVLENPHVLSGVTWNNVQWSFQTGYQSNWHPLTWMSHMLDVQWFGLNPARHHLVSLLFHVANAILLFLLLQRLTSATWRSAFVAALFALHPLHVESVAWVAERKDVLSTFFFMLTLGAYARYAQGKTEAGKWKMENGVWYLFALVLFALGLMSKPMLVTLPCLLLLLDWWPLGRIKTQDWRTTIPRLLVEKIPFLLLCVASSIATFWVQREGHSVSTITSLPLESRFSNAVASYWNYLGKTLWPARLAIYYPHPAVLEHSPDQWSFWQVVLGLAALAAISVMAVIRLKRMPWLATGWFWYVGTLVPVIGIVQVGGQAMADRYTYIPLIGIFVCITWMAATLFRGNRFGKPLLAATGILLGVACAATTWKQVQCWRNNFTVFDHALKVTANNAVAHDNVGQELGALGKHTLALEHFRASAAADPNFPNAHYDMAVTLAYLGRTEEAVQEYQIALRLKPNDVTHAGLGAMFWLLGKADESLQESLEALRLNPSCAEAHCNAGIALSAKGNLTEAADHFAAAAQSKPDLLAARTRLAETLVKLGKLADAAAQLRTVAELWPTNAEAHAHLGDVLQLLHQPAQAQSAYEAALHLKPDYAEVHYDFGRLLWEKSEFANAGRHFQEVVRLKPDFIPALTDLGRTLAVEGQFAEAATQFQAVVRLCPTNAAAQIELGKALMMSGQTNLARDSFADALRLENGLVEENLKKARSFTDQGRFDEALGSFTTALWLKPDDPDVHESLGLFLAQQHKFDEAISQFRETVRLRPDAQAYYNLGLAHVVLGNTLAAVTNYQQALRLKPDWTTALNNLAWILATDPDREVRDGSDAVHLAERACQLDGKQARFWGTLDAAYAEAGRFSEAIATAEKARDLAFAAGQNDIAQAAENRLTLYHAGKAYHEAPKQ